MKNGIMKVGNEIYQKVGSLKASIHEMMALGDLPNPYELRSEDVGQHLDDDFGTVMSSDVGRKVYLRDDIIQMESMDQAEERRRSGAPVGPPAELDYPDDWDDEEDELPEEEFSPDEDDAFIQSVGMGSQVSLTIEEKYIDTFRNQEEAEAFLVEWTEENQFWPNLWYINDHGNIDDYPTPYGGAVEDAGPGRQEGATYRKSAFDPSQLRVTEDEYGTLYIIPGVSFTGDIVTDVDQMSQDLELDNWLYGELGSDESITDEQGNVVYGGSDVQDTYKYLGLTPPRESIATSSSLGDQRIALNWEDEQELPDEEYELPEEEFNPSIEEEYLPGDEDILPPDEEDNFPFDVSILDDNVLDRVRSERDYNADIHIEVDYDGVLANSIPDMDKAERLLNDASVVTSVGGRYSLEREGNKVYVLFEADSDMSNKLFDEFVPEGE